jgi:hypothetical protein
MFDRGIRNGIICYIIEFREFYTINSVELYHFNILNKAKGFANLIR